MACRSEISQSDLGELAVTQHTGVPECTNCSVLFDFPYKITE